MGWGARRRMNEWMDGKQWKWGGWRRMKEWVEWPVCGLRCVDVAWPTTGWQPGNNGGCSQISWAGPNRTSRVDWAPTHNFYLQTSHVYVDRMPPLPPSPSLPVPESFCLHTRPPVLRLYFQTSNHLSQAQARPSPLGRILQWNTYHMFQRRLLWKWG